VTGLRTGLIAGLAAFAAMGLLAPIAFAAPTEPGGEFHWPSPSQVPAPSPYNTTPACPPSSTDSYDCEESTLPSPDANNPEKYINSAYWPAEKRPDIEMYAVMQYGYEYRDCSAVLPHYCFLLDAEAVGYPVTHTPQAGDLWLAPCADLIWMGQSYSGCGGSEGWYLGYVEEVFPDGSFIQSWGGSATPADTGLALTWMSASMDMGADFIGFFPSGQFPHLAGSKCAFDICPTSTEAPRLSSEVPHQGHVVSVTEGTWSGMAPITNSYQWQLCDSNGNGCTGIPGATSSTYTPTAADVGRVVAAVVTGTNEVDSVAAYPAKSARIQAPGPRIDGFRIRSFGKGTRGRTKAERLLRVSYTLSARSAVRLSIVHKTRINVTTAHGKQKTVISRLVLRVTLKGHPGLNVHALPDKLPRGTYCATLTASAQGSSNSAEACF